MKSILFTFISLLSISALTHAQIIRVPTDQTTIQAAIDAASEGDTVLVAEGTYYENINYKGKAITVASEYIQDGDNSHVSKTIIDGSQPIDQDKASVVTMTSGEDTTSVLTGFTITNGTGSYSIAHTNIIHRAGCGIFINSSGAKIEHNIIENNTPDLSNRVYDRVSGIGLAATINDEYQLIVRCNIFRNNSYNGQLITLGGGMAIQGGPALIENNTISNNMVISSGNEANGGAIFYVPKQDDATTTNKFIIRNNYITNNKISCTQSQGYADGGGIDLRGLSIPTDIKIYNNIIANNQTNKLGGGIAVLACEPRIYNNTIYNNSATLGNQVYNKYEGAPFLFNNIIWSDTYKTEIAKANGTITVTYCDVRGGYPGLGNINEEPMLDPETFELTEGSPCVGKGAYSVKIEETWHPVPDLDYCNRPRPNAVDHWTDIGAIESEFVRADDPTLIKVPEEIATIQAAIDAATEGDTVLVAEGTYFENINYKGKAITVASLFVIDGDTSHISKTIIDGSQPAESTKASVVTFESGEDTTSVLSGFTITGGTGTKKQRAEIWYEVGGGISILYSGGKVVNNYITANNIATKTSEALGGGIFVLSTESRVVLRNNKIYNNKTSTDSYSHGGGISISDYSKLKLWLEHNSIFNNKTIGTSSLQAVGGGVFYTSFNPWGSKIYIRNNLITRNEVSGAYSSGGGLLFLINPFNDVVKSPAPYIEISNNIISGNSAGRDGGGLWFFDKNIYFYSITNPVPVLLNNTIVDNSAPDGPEIFNYAFKLLLLNNIVWNDLSPISNSQNGKCLAFYNDIKGGYAGEGNIDTDPLFDPETFGLLNSSPCIGKGIDSIEINDNWYYAPVRDFRDSIRPKPANTNPDIGAMESSMPWPDGIRQTRLLNDYVLIYPNPLSEIATVSLTNHALITGMELIDVSGKVVQQTENLQNNEVILNRKGLSNGIYLLRVHADRLYLKKVILQ